MVRLGNLILVQAKTDARVQWGLGDDRELENWEAGLRLLRAWYYYDSPELRLGLFQAMKWVDLFSRTARVLCYRSGGS
jgi:hypothetical protein